MLDGKVNLGKVNCDNHQQICQRASIRAYPTVKYYKGSINSERQVNFERYFLLMEICFFLGISR